MTYSTGTTSSVAFSGAVAPNVISHLSSSALCSAPSIDRVEAAPGSTRPGSSLRLVRLE